MAISVVILSFEAPAYAAQSFFPLQDIRPGLRGVGLTVFAGERVEEFQVEILGTLPNMGPKGTIVLARLSGGPLAETGVMQGMSGSPVYIDGKLLGAVALGFPFSKEPIAGIQPIEPMIEGSSIGKQGGGTLLSGTGVLPSLTWTFTRSERSAHSSTLNAQTSVASPFGELTSLLTPLGMSGVTPATAQTFIAQFRQLGFSLSPGSTRPPDRTEQAAKPSLGTQSVVPGSMISVGLLTGDLNVTADGTVTYVDGNRMYAFGHRFLDVGSTELPFAHSSVVAILPNLNSSFKLSTARQWVGTILSDRSAAISGEIGRPAHTLPLSVGVHSSATGTHDYHMQVVNDRFLTPVLTQTALFSILDATERTLGSGTLQLTGEVHWIDSTTTPLLIRDTFISDSGLVQQVAADAVVPLGFVLSGGFANLRAKDISFHIETSEAKRQLHLAQAWTSTHEVHPGDSLEVHALLEGENGQELVRSVTYQVPSGAVVGPLNFTVSDANTLNFPEFAGLSQSSSTSADALIKTINSFRNSESLYVRVWRPEPAFTVAGPTPSGELTDPPPSIALILADPSNSVTSNAATAATRGSSITELSIPANGYVVTGAKTLQVDVKE